jgi:hypothetical protein
MKIHHNQGVVAKRCFPILAGIVVLFVFVSLIRK